MRYEETERHTKTILKSDNHEVRIEFEKKDGTLRTMRCTLDESRIPEEHRPKNTETKFSDEAQRVYDLDLGQWRSFRWDSIKSIEYVQLSSEK